MELKMISYFVREERSLQVIDSGLNINFEKDKRVADEKTACRNVTSVIRKAAIYGPSSAAAASSIVINLWLPRTA